MSAQTCCRSLRWRHSWRQVGSRGSTRSSYLGRNERQMQPRPSPWTLRRMLGAGRMSVTNIFLCDCGHRIGRPADQRPGNVGWGVVPWHAEAGEAKLHGIKCSQCRRNWLFTPSRGGQYVEVEHCCDEHRCGCRYVDQEVPEGRYCPRCMVHVNDPHFSHPYICDDCWTEADESE